MGSRSLHPKHRHDATERPLTSRGEAMKRVSVMTAVATIAVLSAHISTSKGTALAAQGPTGSARVVVKVVLDDSAPTPAKIPTNADPYCARAHQAEPLLSQTVQVGSNGALMNVLVFVKDGISGSYT